MLPQDLKIGHAYYRVTYADPQLTIPGVMPMIYVGSNISADDIPEVIVHYFQDTTSHSWRGPVTGARHQTEHPEVETALFPHSEAQVQRDVMTLGDVISTLTQVHARGR